MRRTVIALVSIWAVYPLANAAEAFRNGQPCMDGLCIGDGLPEVAKVKWDPAVVHVPFEPKEAIASLKVKDKRRAAIEKIWSETETYPNYEGRIGASPREVKTLILNAATNPR